MSAELLVRRAEVFVMVPSWLSRYAVTWLLYLPTPPCLSNVLTPTGAVKIISRTENELMTTACFFSAGKTAVFHGSFGYLQLNQHCGAFMLRYQPAV